MRYIKSGTMRLLVLLSAAAALFSCAGPRSAGMPSGPSYAVESTGPPGGRAAEAVGGRPSDGKAVIPAINWLPWSDEAFKKAGAENKLVFLYISSGWSEWPGTTGRGFPYGPETAGIIEKNYIPVYVNADMRPDVYGHYGRGGLPSLSILNPGGYVLASADAMTAPELDNLLTMLARNYAKNKSVVDEALEKSSGAARPRPPTENYPLKKMPRVTLAALAEQWDHVYGGMGRKKFPMPETLDFLVYVSEHPGLQGGTDAEKLARAALDGMASGLFDRSEGGFFRYSDTPDWKSPHREKLLGLNSELIITYLTAYEAYGDKEYLKTGESSARFLREYLLDKKTGAFMNAMTEGLGPDRTVYADGNGKAALAFLEVYRATGRREYLATALKSLDYVINNLYNARAGVAHYAGEWGDGRAPGMLDLSDQVFPGLAAVRAFQATGNEKYLDFAVKVCGICDAKFYDPVGFGYYGFWYAHTPPGLLKFKKKPQAENAAMSGLLFALRYLTGRDSYKAMAGKTLTPFIPAYRKYPAWSAPVALAAARLVSATCQLFVVGGISEPGFGELLEEAYRFEDQDRVVVPLEPERDEKRIKGLGYGHENGPMLYVCSASACFSPIKPGDGIEGVRSLLKKCKETERQKYGR